jgi:hypothetical protein
MRLAINFNFLLKSDLRYVFTVEKIKLEFFHCATSKDDVIGCTLGITVNLELVFEQETGANSVSWNRMFASPVVT